MRKKKQDRRAAEISAIATLIAAIASLIASLVAIFK